MEHTTIGSIKIESWGWEGSRLPDSPMSQAYTSTFPGKWVPNVNTKGREEGRGEGGREEESTNPPKKETS